MAGENQSGMQCVEVEALLAEALDGTLQGTSWWPSRPISRVRLLPDGAGGPGRNALAEGAG